MAHIISSTDQLIGNTPLLKLSRTEKEEGLSARLLAKLEFCNPSGSVKDRVAKAMLDDGEKRGLLRPGGCIIEPTSGNTGIALCALAAARDYKCMIVMPDSMSAERQFLIKAYGAEVVLTPGSEGMAGAIAKARELAKRLPNSFIPSQFENPINPAIHEATTGPEIWADTDGDVDFFVAGAGTGGTITGVGSFLKAKKSTVQIVAAEPADSPVLSGGKAGKHGIQGIGPGFVPEILDMAVIDQIITVTDENAKAAACRIGKNEGILVGISSGAALFAAISIAKLPENAGKTVVTLLPDSGERYLSSGLYA